VPRLRIFISLDLLHSSNGRFSGANFFTSNLNCRVLGRFNSATICFSPAIGQRMAETSRELGFAKPEEKSLLYSPYRILASLVTSGRVAGHLNFDIPSVLDHALPACRAKTGAFVGLHGTTVALDDVETDLRRADFGGPGLDRRHQRRRCACTPEIRVHPHCHQVNYGEVVWITAAGHQPARFATCFKKECHTGSQPPPPILRRPGQLSLIGLTKGSRRIAERLKTQCPQHRFVPDQRLTSNRILLSISFAIMSMLIHCVLDLGRAAGSGMTNLAEGAQTANRTPEQ
jgi:hypothetical protein